MSKELKERFTRGEWFIKTGSECDGVNGVSVYYPHGFLCSANVIKVDDTRLDGESWIDMRHRTKKYRVDAALESNANQYLIAAAPDMYRMLNELSGFLLACEDGSMTRNNMQNLAGELGDNVFRLLAKARGEQGDK